MNTIFSNVCRVTDAAITDYLEKQEIDVSSGSAIIPIPVEVLKPRQVIVPPNAEYTACYAEHRGQFVLTVKPAEAARLVKDEKAEYAEQSVLVYSRESYLSDNDVKADEEEFARVSKSDAEVVIVDIIGAARSALAVCRNIVSGCQKDESLKADAEKALSVSNYVLIED
jgi:hypothetical protein